MRALLFICMMAGAIACSGQNGGMPIYISDLPVLDYGIEIAKPGCDTSPVVLIYMTTTRLFAAAPEYHYELALVEGWLIQCFDGERFRNQYYDRSGIEYAEDVIVTWKKRKL